MLKSSKHTACTNNYPVLTTRSSIADKPPNASCPLANDWIIGRIFRLLPTSLPFDALNEGVPLSYQVHIWYRKTRMAGLRPGEGRMMIDSVVWAQQINVTDTQTATSPYKMSCQRTASSSNKIIRKSCTEWHTGFCPSEQYQYAELVTPGNTATFKCSGMHAVLTITYNDADMSNDRNRFDAIHPHKYASLAYTIKYLYTDNANNLISDWSNQWLRFRPADFIRLSDIIYQRIHLVYKKPYPAVSEGRTQQ